MAKFRKRPVIVKAEQFWVDKPLPFRDKPAVIFGYLGFYVETIHEQRVYLADGDWVIEEDDGIHFYACKPAQFAAIYEPVEDSESYITEYGTCSNCGELIYLDDLAALDFQAEESGVQPGTVDGPAVHWAVGTIRCPYCSDRLPYEISS